jgi:hypothetical protein
MAQKKYFCPYCPKKDRKPYAGQGLASHQRFNHPGAPFIKATKKGAKMQPVPVATKRKKAQEKIKFVVEPIGGDAPSDYDAEFRLHIVLKIDVEK